jgi:light-regulated signal transduction histidine kinase (bacteriophytochrome)
MASVVTERKTALERVEAEKAALESRVVERTAALADANKLLSVEADEHKRTVAELRLAKDAVTATNKELEAFSYSVAHDLRGPLRAIDGYSLRILQTSGGRLDASAQELFSRIRGAAQRMGVLIADILELSKTTTGDVARDPVDLAELARGILEELHRAEPGRKGGWVVPAILMAEGDARLLAIALQNLLANAWKFSRHRPEARIELGTTHREGRHVFFVRDNGAGFDMAYAERLFQPFARLHSSREFPGTGIGLATVRRVIERHRGSVWAEAEVDRGATIYFTLWDR